MAEILTNDQSVPAEVMAAQEANIADSLRVGEELEAAHEQRLAGKYKNTEELEAAYLELQKKLGSQDDGEVDDTDSNVDNEDAWIQDTYATYLETGELDSESISKLNEMSSIDVFETLSKNPQQPVARDLTESEVASIYSSVGGEDQYAQMVSWAKNEFPAEDIEAYDSMIESGNMSQIKLAIQGLYYRYTDSVGQDGNMLQGKPAQAESGFRSQAELIQAMNDPRYESDPAYRQDVLEKLDRSDVQF